MAIRRDGKRQGMTILGKNHSVFAVAHGNGYEWRCMARYASRNNEPLARWHDHPVYLTTILTALFVVGVLGTAVLHALHAPFFRGLIFEMPLDPAWSLWRLVTYVFVAPLSFFTPFSIMCFYWWSMGVETHLGRDLLARLLILLVLASPLAAAVWWWGFGMPAGAMGNYVFTSGLLVAFTTLYPNAEFWGWVPFKWVAFFCLVCGSLMLITDSNWIELSQLWGTCLVGFAYTRHAKELEFDDYESPLARLGKLFQRKPKLRVLPSPAVRERYRPEVEDEDAMSEVDALLDKIKASGIASLTPRERARLEEARAALMKKDER